MDCIMYLGKTSSQSPTSKRLQDEYEQESLAWIQNGWLLPYLEDELGLLRGLIPLMAILLENKQKVCPVMDYRKFNEHVDLYTANVTLWVGYIFTYMYTHVCVCVHPYMCTCVCINIYAHAQVCAHIHTHMWQDELDLVWVSNSKC